MQFVPLSNIQDYKNRLWGLMDDIKKIQFTEGVKCYSLPSSVVPGSGPEGKKKQRNVKDISPYYPQVFTFWGHWSKFSSYFHREICYKLILKYMHNFVPQIRNLWVPPMYFRVTKIDVDIKPTPITSAPSNHVF